MFFLLLGINAYTDLREGCVYDALSLALFAAAFIQSKDYLLSPWALGSLFMLFLVWKCDPKERYLGRGDYLILLSASLYFQSSLPQVLLWTSGTALVTMAFLNKRQMPLIPFLFLGSLIPELTIF